MRRLVVGILCLAAAILFMTGSATASHDPTGEPFDEDFVIGSVCLTAPPASCNGASFDAHSGPTGESPTGFSTVGERLGIQGGPVSCVTTTGSRAVIGGRRQFGGGLDLGYLIEVEDNAASAAPDRFGFTLVAGVPSICPNAADLDVFLLSIASGDLVVHDAVPPVPTTKEQCKDGGWRDFPQFENQGRCVRFVKYGS